MPYDGIFARIVRSDRQLDVVVEHVQQVSQVAGAATNILLGIEGILDRIAFGGIGHELHQALGAGTRQG